MLNGRESPYPAQSYDKPRPFSSMYSILASSWKYLGVPTTATDHDLTTIVLLDPAGATCRHGAAVGAGCIRSWAFLYEYAFEGGSHFNQHNMPVRVHVHMCDISFWLYSVSCAVSVVFVRATGSCVMMSCVIMARVI
jgi:hypothetical protein